MTHTTLDAPAAGWYDDPSAVAAYRWWDGSRWTAATLPERPSQGAGSPLPTVDTTSRPQPLQRPHSASTSSGGDTVARLTETSADPGALPTRRSLRAQAAAAAAAAAPTGTTGPTAAPALAAPENRTAPAARPAPTPMAAESLPPASAQPSAPSVTTAAGQRHPLQPTAAAASSEPALLSPTSEAPTPPGRPIAPTQPNRPIAPTQPNRSAALGQPSASPEPREPFVTPASQAAPVVYRPVNPLAGPAVPSVPVSPPGFTVPAAWAANAPAAPPTPGYALVPGQPGRPPYTASGSYGSTRPQPRNIPAQLGLSFLVLAAVISGLVGELRNLGVLVTPTAVILVALMSLVVVGLLIASIPLAIAGLVNAARYKRNGFAAKGRARSIVVLALVAVILAANASTFVIGFRDGFGRATQSSTPAGNSQAATPVTEPDVGILQGDGTYVYSQAQAQNSIGSAYTTALKSAPSSVVCPATEPLQVSISFVCTVTIQGGTVTTAQVTIVDPEGHVEVQVH